MWRSGLLMASLFCAPLAAVASNGVIPGVVEDLDVASGTVFLRSTAIEKTPRGGSLQPLERPTIYDRLAWDGKRVRILPDPNDLSARSHWGRVGVVHSTHENDRFATNFTVVFDDGESHRVAVGHAPPPFVLERDYQKARSRIGKSYWQAARWVEPAHAAEQGLRESAHFMEQVMVTDVQLGKESGLPLCYVLNTQERICGLEDGPQPGGTPYRRASNFLLESNPASGHPEWVMAARVRQLLPGMNPSMALIAGWWPSKIEQQDDRVMWHFTDSPVSFNFPASTVKWLPTVRAVGG
jgi:hypothetical protein